MVVNQQILEGKWNEVSGKIKQKWGKLTEDDLRNFNGNVDQLIGRIQTKTGESREVIEHFLAQIAEESSEFAANVRDKVQQGAAHVADSARESYDSLKQGFAEAEKVVQERPGQAVAIAFGLGLVAGVGVSLLLRDRGVQATAMGRGRAAAEQLGKQLVDALSHMVSSKS